MWLMLGIVCFIACVAVGGPHAGIIGLGLYFLATRFVQKSNK